MPLRSSVALKYVSGDVEFQIVIQLWGRSGHTATCCYAWPLGEGRREVGARQKSGGAPPAANLKKNMRLTADIVAATRALARAVRNDASPEFYGASITALRTELVRWKNRPMLEDCEALLVRLAAWQSLLAGSGSGMRLLLAQEIDELATMIRFLAM